MLYAPNVRFKLVSPSLSHHPLTFLFYFSYFVFFSFCDLKFLVPQGIDVARGVFGCLVLYSVYCQNALHTNEQSVSNVKYNLTPKRTPFLGIHCEKYAHDS